MSAATPKPIASLSSGLLARKGHARPAMRPQGFGGFGSLPTAQDDLGWNDMGLDEAALPASAPVPPVVRQFEALQEEFGGEMAAEVPTSDELPVVDAQVDEAPAPAPTAVMPPPVTLRPVSVATAARIDRETAAKPTHKAAFTLRLDHDRHLRLRLASALHHRSAQALVTDALDVFLHSLPEVEDLVRQLPPPKAGR
ncbi:MAG: hypothetical protein ABIS14_05335 [Sphingomonas sp.]